MQCCHISESSLGQTPVHQVSVSLIWRAASARAKVGIWWPDPRALVPLVSSTSIPFAQETWPLLLPSLPSCLWRLPPDPSLFGPETGHHCSFFLLPSPSHSLGLGPEWLTSSQIPECHHLAATPALRSFNSSRLIAAVPFPAATIPDLFHSP